MCDDKPFSISLPSLPTSLHAGGQVDPQLCALREHGRSQTPSPPLLQTTTKGSGQGCPPLRASSDHRFIVGALRARRAFDLPSNSPSLLVRLFFPRAAWSILNCARRTSTFLSCAFREQEDDQGALSSYFLANASSPSAPALGFHSKL
jgi:hypothetical protein